MATLDIEVRSRADAIPAAGERVADFAAQSGFDAQGCFEWQVVVVEALNNVVSHALSDRAARAAIALHCARVANTVCVTIVDDGRPLDGLPDTELPRPDVENGRGWPIIARWTDAIAYRSVPGRNELTLTRRAPGGCS